MRANGHGKRKLTHNTKVDELPSWFPGGGALAFNSDRDGDQEIFRISARGRHTRQLTPNAGRDDAPDVSPSGKIAYEGLRAGSSSDSEIFKMDGDGHHRRQITHNDLTDEYPGWGRLR